MTLSCEPKYTVKQAARLAGLTANQLRLWQKRHQLVSPQRADNGYRLYSDRDVLVLSFVADEVRRGRALTAIGEQREGELLREAKRWQRQMKKEAEAETEGPAGATTQEMIQALQAGEGARFQAMLARRHSGLGLGEMLRRVDLPLLRAIGKAFTEGELDIAGEHLGSVILKSHMLTRLHSLGGQGGERPFLLAGAADDFHETGLLAGALELAAAGLPYLLLGAATPDQHILRIAGRVKARGVVVVFTSPCSLEFMTKSATVLQKGLSCPVALSGYQALKAKAKLKKSKVSVLDNFEALLPWAESA